MNSTDAKRVILENQPGKRFAYRNVTAARLDADFFEFMTRHNPAVRIEHLDGYAVAAAAAIQAGQQPPAFVPQAEARFDDQAAGDFTDGEIAMRSILMRTSTGGRRIYFENLPPFDIRREFASYMQQRGASMPNDPKEAARLAKTMWANMSRGA
ncbi:hypothetical protein AB6T85_23605 [Erwinia sp. ACCC 02193]|uniref:Uncharacterized protein n=1 Tax=Erwinia aeris TaxID=3239803 RepID=A0ABV4EEM8_9GAMM